MDHPARLVGQDADALRGVETLLAIATTVNSTLDVPEALRRICRELAHLLGAHTAAATAPIRLRPARAGRRVSCAQELMQTLLGSPIALSGAGALSPSVGAPPGDVR